jgi:uncharacterized protein YjbJ (UPF0337 family)
MNRDQIKGRGKEAVGKLQQQAGKLAGSPKHRAKGLVKEAVGKVQKTMGDARQDIERADKESRRDGGRRASDRG